MTTPKQIIANQQNALLSTGAITEEGKNIVAQNAIKHGIFTKDLIIAAGDGKENLEDYQELLNNLVTSLAPTGQMQYILVEKIAVDCWRLKRVLCYETGCIRQFLDTVIFDHSQPKDDNNFYALRPKNNEDLDKEMRETQDYINWNNNYIKALQNGEVKFDNPICLVNPCSRTSSMPFHVSSTGIYSAAIKSLTDFGKAVPGFNETGQWIRNKSR